MPYQQALAWCYCDQSYTTTSQFSTSASPVLSHSDTFDNGIISVKVLTLLTAPVASSTVSMQVFVRGAENMEFGNPSTAATAFTPFAMQSEEYSETRESVKTELGSTSDLITERNRVYLGEHVRSLRTILRRSTLLDVTVPATNATNLGYWRFTQYRYPPHYGYDPNGYGSAKGITVPASNFPFNFVIPSAYHLVSLCFVGQKGAMHWHYNWDGANDVTMRVSRQTSNVATVGPAYVGITAGTASANMNSFMSNSANTSPGTAVVNQKTNAGLSVSMPNYSVFKFQSTKSSMGTFPNDNLNGASTYEQHLLDVNNNGAVQNLNVGRLERYFSIGTDFNLYFFLNCPTMYAVFPGSLVPN